VPDYDPLTISDAHSRYLLRCHITPKCDGAHVAAVFDACFREHGLPLPGGPAFEKTPGDWVTAADLASEHAILEVLARRAPGVAVLAEETGGDRAGTMWAVDPLDGTRNYTRGFPVFAVSVALIEDGRPEVGVVLAPWLDLEFRAQRGRGARRVAFTRTNER